MQKAKAGAGIKGPRCRLQAPCSEARLKDLKAYDCDISESSVPHEPLLREQMWDRDQSNKKRRHGWHHAGIAQQNSSKT